MRGLKLCDTGRRQNIGMSHLLQMRGLKPRRWLHIQAYPVASFTDAWIETKHNKKD